MRKIKKSTLAKQAEKFFVFHESAPVPPLEPSTTPNYMGGPVIIQTFTTYSACELPIPDPRWKPVK
jgi:hypothetical protein